MFVVVPRFTDMMGRGKEMMLFYPQLVLSIRGLWALAGIFPGLFWVLAGFQGQSKDMIGLFKCRVLFHHLPPGRPCFSKT